MNLKTNLPLFVLTFAVPTLGCCESFDNSPVEVAREFSMMARDAKLTKEHVRKCWVAPPREITSEEMNKQIDEFNKQMRLQEIELQKDLDKKGVKDRTRILCHEATFVSTNSDKEVLIQLKDYIGKDLDLFTGSYFISLREVEGKWKIVNPFEHLPARWHSQWKESWRRKTSN